MDKSAGCGSDRFCHCSHLSSHDVGTSERVDAHFAANTIGLQMAAAGLGSAIIPSFLGILARQISLEIIPIGMVISFGSLFGLYLLADTSKLKA
ncbi:hypothetical protein [Candidatus Villigracilis affinis]|uniref:hypothetical protein n=1 Tax=Candidatus Villigracilis affinis TaxID=3140682 RepID=UPI0031E8062A